MCTRLNPSAIEYWLSRARRREHDVSTFYPVLGASFDDGDRARLPSHGSGDLLEVFLYPMWRAANNLNGINTGHGLKERKGLGSSDPSNPKDSEDAALGSGKLPSRHSCCRVLAATPNWAVSSQRRNT